MLLFSFSAKIRSSSSVQAVFTLCTLTQLSQVHGRPEAFSRLLLLSLTFANYWPLLFPSIMPALKMSIWQFMSYAPVLHCIPKKKTLGTWGQVVYLVIDDRKRHWGNETGDRKVSNMYKCGSVLLGVGDVSGSQNRTHLRVAPLLWVRSGIYPPLLICHGLGLFPSSIIFLGALTYTCVKESL